MKRIVVIAAVISSGSLSHAAQKVMSPLTQQHDKKQAAATSNKHSLELTLLARKQSEQANSTATIADIEEVLTSPTLQPRTRTALVTRLANARMLRHVPPPLQTTRNTAKSPELLTSDDDIEPLNLENIPDGGMFPMD